MHSPLERSAGAHPSRRRHGPLVHWIGLVLLWVVGLASGSAPSGDGRPDAPLRTMPLATAVSAEPSAAPATLPQRGDDAGDRIAKGSQGEAAAEAIDLAEPTEEIEASPTAPALVASATTGAKLRLRRDDVRVAWRAVRIAPTRAPPAIAGTVG